mgnify:CR=1 FL=1
MVFTIEYVWIGGNNELRSKTKIIEGPVKSVDDLPNWNYDGSSTGQAQGSDSEVIIKPRALFENPFQRRNGFLVLCDTYQPSGAPLKNNHRHWAKRIFDEKLDEEPWFGLEQEYYLMTPNTNYPLGFQQFEEQTQGQYYCSVGAENAFGREIAERHMNYCIEAGIKISGINAEVGIGQWEYQIGPCVGIEMGDHLWMARYIMQRVAEDYNVAVNIDPKPLEGEWNGSGCHANYSTKNMREGSNGIQGIQFIEKAITKLESTHAEHMKVYGDDNNKRMTGKHETADFHNFTSGIADRSASVRIGNETYLNCQGYFEDRRPGSNCDPYLVSGYLFKTTCLD